MRGWGVVRGESKETGREGVVGKVAKSVSLGESWYQ